MLAWTPSLCGPVALDLWEGQVQVLFGHPSVPGIVQPCGEGFEEGILFPLEENYFRPEGINGLKGNCEFLLEGD